MILPTLGISAAGFRYYYNYSFSTALWCISNFSNGSCTNAQGRKYHVVFMRCYNTNKCKCRSEHLIIIITCGESWHAMKDSLTHRPSSQGWAPGVLPFLYKCFVCLLYVLGWRDGGRRVATYFFLFYYLYSWASML